MAASPAPATPPGICFRDVTAQAGLHFVHSGGVRSSLLPEDMGSGAEGRNWIKVSLQTRGPWDWRSAAERSPPNS